MRFYENYILTPFNGIMENCNCKKILPSFYEILLLKSNYMKFHSALVTIFNAKLGYLQLSSSKPN